MASDEEDKELVEKKKDTKKKVKKKKSKVVDNGGEDATETEADDSDVLASPEGKKKKKSKKTKDDDTDLDSPDGPTKSPSKKKKKKKTTEEGGDDIPETPLLSPESKKKKKKKAAANGDNTPDDELLDVFSPSPKQKLTSLPKYSVEYFEAILEEVKEKCEKKMKIKSKDREAFLEGCAGYYETWYNKFENEQWLVDLVEKDASKDEMEEAQKYVDESNAALPQHKNYCIRTALEIFQQLDEDRITALEDKLVKGAIVAQASPRKLAEFASQGKENEKILKQLFSRPKLMKRMLQFGGAAKYEYGNAMKIYMECVGDDNDDADDMPKLDDDGEEEYDEVKETEKAWGRVNRKIALACALELASPIYEFDTATAIDAVARYKHFEKAHRKGELDPAFPFFSVWEMRQIVNCDAPNDQMEWCRKMVMNYVPHLTCLTDNKLRYTYIMQSDVRIRKPNWKSSPRTYQMVLSGGGNESVNSWFGRFVLKSFGIPTWGSKYRRKEGFTRWTPEGWAEMNGANWETAEWNGKSGKDFKTEVEARNKAPQEEYFKKLVTLQCLADVVDGDPSLIPDYEKDAMHGERLWRSLSIVSMELLFQTEPEVQRTFERKGEGLVKTKCEKYLEKYEKDAPDAEISFDQDKGILLIPASRHGFSDGNILLIDSYTGGKQLNFIADGVAEYELPEIIPAKKYSLAAEVCTVSSSQTPLSVQVGEDGEKKEIKVPYTVGEYEFTKTIKIDLSPGDTLRFSRPKGSLGVAIKKFILR